MNAESLDKIKGFLRQYADRYVSRDGRLHPVLLIKVQHSRRVAEECRGIAADLGWPADDVRAGEALGLLHDIARFEQFSRFGTLVDAKSVDHGEKGYEVAQRPEFDTLITGKYRDSILAGIRYHNKRLIPQDLSEDARRFVKLIRDADKLDIMFAVTDSIRHGRHKTSPELLLDIDLEGPANQELVKQIREHKSGSYTLVKSLIDLGIVWLTWVYDINYLPTLRRIEDRRLLDQMVETMAQPPSEDILQIKEDSERYVRAKLEDGNQLLG